MIRKYLTTELTEARRREEQRVGEECFVVFASEAPGFVRLRRGTLPKPQNDSAGGVG